MVYSPSQLDAAGDVDPVAEADVYLAYGRDLQAEEILKEALRTNPQRVAIHSKLLEIYAKRRDAKAFELVAAEAYSLTHGDGPEWEHICELGQELDPSNPLYQPGGQPSGSAPHAAAAAVAAAGVAAAAASVRPAPASAAGRGQPAPTSVDLDLDFSLDDDPSACRADAGRRRPRRSAAAPPPSPPLDMDFGTRRRVGACRAARHAARRAQPHAAGQRPQFRHAEPAGLPSARACPSAAAAPAAPAADNGMIEFDLGALSLDLPELAPRRTSHRRRSSARRRLAEHCRPRRSSTHDGDRPAGHQAGAGARSSTPSATPTAPAAWPRKSLAEASGDLKSQAQRFLAEIG